MNTLEIRDNCAVFQGSFEQNSVHSHHAIQLCIAKEGTLIVEVAGQSVQCRGILINSQVPHRIDPASAPMALILFEPVFRGKYRLAKDIPPWAILDEESNEYLDLILAGEIEAIISRLAELYGIAEIDARIQKLISHITTEENCKHSLEFFSNAAKLSASRLSHLFKNEIGISLKKYLLFQKLLFVVDSMRANVNITDIAIDCGFHDVSHLSRTFREIFGFSTSHIFRNSSSVQVDFVN